MVIFMLLCAQVTDECTKDEQENGGQYVSRTKMNHFFFAVCCLTVTIASMKII